MKLALHRSITFWSGILVMVFLVSAWWHSTRTWASINRGEWTLRHCGSGISLSCIRLGATKEWHLLTGEAGDLGLQLDQWRFGRPFFIRNRATGPRTYQGPFDTIGDGEDPMAKDSAVWYFGEGSWDLFLPHWLLIVAIAIPWSGLLVWRARRRKRAPIVV